MNWLCGLTPSHSQTSEDAHPLFNANTHTLQAYSGLRLRDKSSADALLYGQPWLRCLRQHEDEDYVVISWGNERKQKAEGLVDAVWLLCGIFLKGEATRRRRKWGGN